RRGENGARRLGPRSKGGEQLGGVAALRAQRGQVARIVEKRNSGGGHLGTSVPDTDARRFTARSGRDPILGLAPAGAGVEETVFVVLRGEADPRPALPWPVGLKTHTVPGKQIDH